MLQHLPGLMTYRQQLTSPVSADEASMEQISDATASVPSDKIEQSSLARLLRLAMKRSGEISSDELKRQLRDVSPQELEAFALLLLELV